MSALATLERNAPARTPAAAGLRRLGLRNAEAERRLACEGANELPRQRQRTFAAILGGVLREPMLLLLVAGGLIYLALGDHGEALMLIVLAGFSITVTVVQEARGERAIEALRDLASPRALVIRDGAPTLLSEPRLVTAWEWTAGRVRPKPKPKPKTAAAEPKIVEADLARPPRPYQVSASFAAGDRIEHPTLGLGVVQGSIGPTKIEVLFDGAEPVISA